MIYQILVTTFALITVLSNIISAKMVPVVGDFIIPAGLLTYPFTFLISDLITEIYGAAKARFMIFLSLGMNVLSFAIIQLALILPGINLSFEEVLGSSALRIFASLVAYLTAQIIDIQSYAMIKKWTGLKWLWLRNNGSTCLSQLVDTVMIDLIFLYFGLGMPFSLVGPIMAFSYLYKACFSLAMTPLFYGAVAWTRKLAN